MAGLSFDGVAGGVARQYIRHAVIDLNLCRMIEVRYQRPPRPFAALETSMKPELLYLLLTAILTGVLWIPVVIGYVTSRGTLTPENYRTAPTSPLPDWVNRANRAHLNAVESFAPFAAVVLIAHAMGVSTPLTVGCAAVYFYARLVHAVVHISGFGLFMARTLLFTVAWVAFLVFALVVLQRAM